MITRLPRRSVLENVVTKAQVKSAKATPPHAVLGRLLLLCSLVRPVPESDSCAIKPPDAPLARVSPAYTVTRISTVSRVYFLTNYFPLRRALPWTLALELLNLREVALLKSQFRVRRRCLHSGSLSTRWSTFSVKLRFSCRTYS